MDKTYLSDAEAAQKLGISLSRLRSRIHEGAPLPPRIEVPNSRIRLWDLEDIQNWLDQHKKIHHHSNSAVFTKSVANKRSNNSLKK
jgi:predicted DNA-binding transcriptional regulator AlpA